MTRSRLGTYSLMAAVVLGLAACGTRTPLGEITAGEAPSGAVDPFAGTRASMGEPTTGSSIWDIFGPDRTDQTVSVNRYIWNASLDVLNFLPIETVDPFTGVIVMGYGTPPGGGRAYRATVHITDPALEARSLRVSLQSRNGPVAAGTSRAVEDAILARARQMRIADDRF